MCEIIKRISSLLENRLVCISLLVATVFLININIIINGFVWDDNIQILKNKWITDIRYIPEMFTSSVWSFAEDVDAHSNFYRPFLHLFFMSGYSLSGLKPWGYHLLSVLLYAGNTVMVFLVASLIFKPLELRKNSPYMFHFPPAFLAAILFATHPIHTEVIAWISAAAQELTFMLFLLIAFYLYIQAGIKSYQSESGSQKKMAWYLKKKRSTLFFFAMIFFFFALLSKETAVTLPLLILLYDYSTGKSFRLSDIRKYLPFLIVIVVYLFLRGYALGNAVATPVYHSYLNSYQHVINSFPLFASYIWKLIFPINLNAFHFFKPVYSLSEPRVIASLLFVLFCIVLLRWLTRIDKLAFFCLQWIGISLLPTLYIPVVSRNPFAERYAYLSSIGFVILVAHLVNKAVKKLESVDKNKAKKSRSWIALTIAALMVIVIGLYSIGTIKRNFVWRSDYTLWTDSIMKSPENYFAYNLLGNTLSKEDMLNEAIEAYKNSLRFGRLTSNPDFSILASAHYNLGVIYGKMGLKEEALWEYDKAIKFKPNLFQAYYNSGIIYYEGGLFDKSVTNYMKALEFAANANNQILVYINLGNAYVKKGLRREAIIEYENVLRIDPTNSIAGHNLRALRRKE